MIETRALGSSGLATPRLVLGGNVFGFTVHGEEAFRILDRFVDAGGTMIDTADIYSAWAPGNKGGESETLIGEWLRRRGRRDGALIATKVGMLPGSSEAHLEPAHVAASIEGSLGRLGTDYVDLYYAHRDDRSRPLEETLGAFDRLVRQGKVRALGASNHDADRLAAALDVSSREGFAAYSVLQNELHLLNRGKFEGQLQRLCIERGLGVLPFYGLANGFLTGKYRSAADKAKSIRGDRMDQYMNERGWRVLAALDEVAAEARATPAQVALAWVAAQPGATAPIASATTVEQLEELIGAMSLDLRADQLQRLDEVSR